MNTELIEHIERAVDIAGTRYALLHKKDPTELRVSVDYREEDGIPTQGFSWMAYFGRCTVLDYSMHTFNDKYNPGRVINVLSVRVSVDKRP